MYIGSNIFFVTGCGTSSSAGSQSTEAAVKEAAVQDTQQKIDVEVDKSQVDNSVPGDYIVYYKAVDSEGNETTREAVYSFKEEETQETQQEAESLEQIVAIVLSEITDDSMSMGEKARAVFNYAHGKIGYSYNNYGGYDWQSEAYYALKDIEKSGYIGGDCFTYLIQNSYSNIKCIS